VTDRYVDSSVAYQGAGRELGAGEIANLSGWATGGLMPDLTVVLDLSADEARARCARSTARTDWRPNRGSSTSECASGTSNWRGPRPAVTWS